MSDRSPQTAAWSACWRAGVAHTLPFAEGLGDDPLRPRWAALAAELSDGAAVLDLGCGNAPVLAQIWAHGDRHGLHLQLVGVDLAQVDLIRAGWPPAARAAVQIHAGVAVETLPFSDHHFALVASQYALEYARQPQGLTEAVRVLAPGGTLAIAVHGRDSLVSTLASEEIDQLCGALRLQLGALLDAADPAVVRAALKSLHGHCRGPSPLPALLGRSVDQALRWPNAASRQAVADLERQIAQSLVRLEDQQHAALDAAARDCWAHWLSELGLVVTPWSALEMRGERLGWWLAARRPAQPCTAD